MIINCLFIIAVCNSIKVREDDDGELEYFGSSPDELALANFARSMGLEYTGIDEE
jgi:magnesium-transporting ATPase (P-type)